MPSVPETAATVKVQNVVKYEPQEYSRLRWEFINSKKAACLKWSRGRVNTRPLAPLRSRLALPGTSARRRGNC